MITGGAGGGGCRVPITSITLLIFNFYMLPKRGTTPCKFKIRVCCEKKWGRGSPPPSPGRCYVPEGQETPPTRDTVGFGLNLRVKLLNM